MIEIDFPEAVEGCVTLKVTGHSGSDEKGRDLMCAAVSALTQTFAGGIQDSLKADVRGKMEAGECNLSIQVPEASRQQLEAVCKVIKFGFRKIAESHPGHVKLN